MPGEEGPFREVQQERKVGYGNHHSLWGSR